jgi:Outer membrane protein beta-barrel domain
MKRLPVLLTALLLGAASAAQASDFARLTPRPANDDTIVVKLPNQASMTLFVKNKAQLRELRRYKLDSLLVLLDGYIAQAEAAGKNSKSEQVTMEFYPAKEQPGKQVPEQIRITVRNQANGTKTAERTDVVLGRVLGVTVYDKTDDQEGVSVRISSTPDSVREAQRKAKREAYANRAVHSNFNVDLGLNTLVNQEAGANGVTPDLRPIGSRYISLNWHYDIRLGRRGSVLYLRTGPELGFNNYMLDGNFQFANTNRVTTVVPAAAGRNLEKSKLAVTTITLPLMPMLQFRGRNDKEGFHLGAGGFVGYRLGSRTKIKYQEEGNTKKDKDRGNYNLEDFQYGVQGLIGIRNVDLFVKYNLNDTFKNNRGPQAQTLSFGISLLN